MDPDRKLYRLAELKTWLLKAKYPSQLINNGFSQILQMEQSKLREKVTKTKENLLPFVQTHNPKNPQVYSKLVEAFKFLLNSEKYSKLLKNTRLIKSERQPKNLGRMLQRSCFTSEKPKWGITKCGKSNCGTCPYLLETDRVFFERVSTTFRIMTTFSCDSRNLIYKISCKGCMDYYIGSSCSLRQRVGGHKSDLRKATKNMFVHKHISSCSSPDFEIPFTIVPFYKCKTNTFSGRVYVENYFRRKFKPQLNGY